MSTNASSPVDPIATAQPEPITKAPENENTLATLAIPLGETVLTVMTDGVPYYGILHRSRAMTGQSDYFRLQFRGYASAHPHEWELFKGDDAMFHSTYNCAWVRVDHPSRSVTFGPKGGVTSSESFKGSGLDTFLFAQVISWAKGAYPDYSVSPGLVSLPSTAVEDERLKKNAFFASQGFEFNWQDATQRTALFFKDKVNKLLGVWDGDHITELGGEAMLLTMAEQEKSHAELADRMARLESTHTSLKTALSKEKNTSQILMGVIVLGLIVGLWAAL